MQILSLDIMRSYYYLKPLIPRRLQVAMRSFVATRKRHQYRDVWPIDHAAGQIPSIWQGWPDNKQFALVLTHDVDTFRGHERCRQLMQLEQSMGFRAAYNFVADEYPVSALLRRHLCDHGFEVGVHGLAHDRSLYDSRAAFRAQSVKINEYLLAWEAVGFRSPCMYHNLEWMHDLNIAYDASTFDTDPFEPQPDGVGTIFPFFVQRDGTTGGYVELPYTLPQDFSLFILLKERTIDVWKQKLAWIAERGGMVLMNTHPDYMHFGGVSDMGFEEYPADFYQQFLHHIRSEYAGEYWHSLPRDVAGFCAAMHNGQGAAVTYCQSVAVGK